MSEWKDKVVIITGASSGIGAGIAFEFARQGCTLALTGRNERNLAETAKQCKLLQSLALGKCEGSCSLENKTLCIVADMFKDEDVKSIVTKTVEKFGKINILINNAGMAKTGSIPNINMNDYDDIMQVNVRSVVQLTQEALPYLIETQGNVVNISSIASFHTYGHLTAYSMSKAALDHFTRCSAIDLAPKKVRINSILPGVIDTPIWERVGMSREEKNQLIQRNTTEHPMGRLGTPEDIGHMAVHLSSDKASFLTGQVITIDGGGYWSVSNSIGQP